MSQWTREPQPLRLQIDYDQLIWQALLDCQHSFQQPDFESRMSQGASVATSQVSTDRFVYNVNTLEDYILPEWEDKTYQDFVKTGEDDPWRRHQAIIRLLHRRNFFKRKDLLEEIEGVMPEELGSQSGSSKDAEQTRMS